MESHCPTLAIRNAGDSGPAVGRVKTAGVPAVCLGDYALWSVTPRRHAAVRVESVSGLLWVSQEGRPDDVILAPGESFVARGHGKVVVQALRAAVMRVEPA
jgi:hypothetical protein